MRVNFGAYMLLMLAGCSGDKAAGTIGGERVSGAKDAIFDRVELLGVEVIVLWITDTADSCEAFEDVLTARTIRCEDTCEELGEAAETWFPGDDFWTLNTTIHASSELAGEYSHEDDVVPAEGKFAASYASWSSALWGDFDACVDECRELDPLTEADLTPATDGVLEISEGDDQNLSGTFDFAFDGEDQLSGRFTATRCSMFDWVL
jgi:hypothetical protein